VEKISVLFHGRRDILRQTPNQQALFNAEPQSHQKKNDRDSARPDDPVSRDEKGGKKDQEVGRVHRMPD